MSGFIGGFFGIEFPPVGAPGLGAFWGMPEAELCFANGRSALSALTASINPPRVWIPAYVCRSVRSAVEGRPAGTVDYFPVDDALEPDTSFLDAAVGRGDMVVAVDYFGRAPGTRFRDFVRGRTDVLFVEDACHAFDTGMPPWGRWCLRSPRKLVGVADGGFIVPADAIAAREHSRVVPAIETHRAALLRFEDQDGVDNVVWHAANQNREAAETVSARGMSRLSRELLLRLPVAGLAARRRANFSTLAAALSQCRFLPESRPDFVPMGFPVRLRNAVRTRVRDALIAEGFFPAIHWDDLPSPSSHTAAHVLAGELLTLPCDHRYQPSDMERMGRLVSSTLASA